MTRNADQMSRLNWPRVVFVLTAAPAGWMLVESGLYAGMSTAFLGAFLPILAVIVVWIFVLPFLKHLPRLPSLAVPAWLSDWVMPWVSVALSSATFCSMYGPSAVYYVAGSMVAVLAAAELFRRFFDRGDEQV